jgi:hypothetical protein
MPRGSFGRSAYRVSALILLLAAGEAGAAELSLKRVVLSTAGSAISNTKPKCWETQVSASTLR